jgi:hypothetical protein
MIDFVRTNADNPYVATYGTAAARAIDDWCNRQFGQLATLTTWTYPGRSAVYLPQLDRWLVLTDDIGDVAGLVVTVDGTTLSAGVDGYQLWPANEIAKGRVHTGITLASCPGAVDVDVTCKFGWTAVPAAVKGAQLLQVNRWNIRRESPYGTGGNATEGSEMRLSTKLDPDARIMLTSVIRARMPR